jgi:hypothetical protein
MKRRSDVRSLIGAFRGVTIAALAACGTGDGNVEFPPMQIHAPDLTLGPPSRELIAGTADDRLEIASVKAVVLDGSTFLVPDFGAHRVLRLDTTFALLDSFGSEGAGPGELMRPSLVMPWNGELVVGEWTNGRFSIFDHAGNFRRTITGAGRPESYGMRRDGGIVMHSRNVDYYAIVLSADGRSVPFAPRPGSLKAKPGAETLGGEATLILVGPGDTTHIFDNEHGILLKYDGNGRLLLGRSVPEEVIQPVRDYRDGVVSAFAEQGRRVIGMSLLNNMSFTDNGSILIHIGRGTTAAIIVDPADYTARRISANMKDPAWALISSASGTIVLGSTYYTFADGGLAAHPLLQGSR